MNPWGVRVPPPTEAEFFNAARSTTFLLVEGGSDARFWLAHVDRRACQVRAAGGRDLALKELETVRSEGKGGFVAVLDADFDRVEGTLAQRRDVVWTDLHDLELVFFASPALDKVLVHVASAGKLESFETAEGHAVRDALLRRGTVLGQLRWLSRRDRLSLTFRKLQADGSFKFLDYHRFCKKASLVLDVREMIQAVMDFSQKPGFKVDDLLRRMGAQPPSDPWQLCVGHDLVGLLAVALRSKLGSRNLSMEELQERLSLAFERADLERTEMYAGLRAWERENAPFRVFAASPAPPPGRSS